MTQYSDVPEVNALYQQREIVDNAIVLIDAGGSISGITIAPPPTPPETLSMGPVMAVSVIVPSTTPTPPETLDAVRAWLVECENAIDAQLAALGVTDAPPAKE